MEPNSDKVLQPYDPVRELAADLFCVDGEWYGSPFKRRMTVVRLRDGSLVIHSAIRMAPADLEKLDRLGRVGFLVIPNVFHYSEAPFYSRRYPQAKVFVPEKLRDKSAKIVPVAGTLERDWPLNEELPCVSFEGTLAAESVFVHRASRTLIVTDMAFNVSASDFTRPIEKLLFGKWNGILDVFGPSKLTKNVAARDRGAVAAALRKLGALDFDRVVMSHGRIVESNGKRLFFEGYRRIYGELPGT